MPASYLGTWEPKTRRWTKMYRGTRLAVSCRQLSKWSGRAVPETKEGSYQAANEWIKAKLAELDAAPTPLDEEMAEIRRRRDWCRARGRQDEAGQYDLMLRLARDTGAPMLTHTEYGRAFTMLQRAGLNPPDDLPDDLVDDLGGRNVWRERLDAGGVAPEKPTLGEALEKYIALKRSKVERGELTSRRPIDLRLSLNYFLQSAGRDTPVESIGEATWSSFYASIAGRSPGYARRLLNTARSFVEWLHAERLCEAPRNLRSRDYVVNVPTKAVQTMDPGLLLRIVELAPGQIPVHLMLFANCGFTQADTSALRHDEVDWKRGVITRKRTKTADEANVPTVTYKLWAETLNLLKVHRSADPERVLLSPTGLPWIEGQSDKFGAAYQRFSRQVKDFQVPPAKLLRKTSASLLETHEVYGRYASYFLGHAPVTIAEKHYVKPSQEQFDRAVAWLGGQYGLGGKD